MILYPAIDIYNGQCVRLSQGRFDQPTVYFDRPLDAAKKWFDDGAQWLHVVDLNGALEGRPIHLEIIKDILKISIPVQVGGGIRDQKTVETLLSLGAKRVVMGSSAIKDPRLVQNLCRDYGEKIAVGLDAKDGRVAVHGWKDILDQQAIDVAKSFEERGVKTIIYTDISRDGMMTGPHFEALEKMISAVSISVIASGGISSIKDIKKLKETGVHGAILGRALYEGKVDLKTALTV